MSDGIEPGGYILKKCSLSNHDGSKTVSIGDMINTIEIEEDISKVCIQGFITITDAVDIIDNFPIIGEEILR